MNWNKGLNAKRGSISVYLCIIMAAVILLCGVLGDLARIKSAGAVAEDVTVSVSRSLMSLYQKDLQRFYGIMGIEIRPEIKQAIQTLLLKNTKIDAGTDIFQLKVEGFQTKALETLGDDRFLKKQILSHSVDDLAQEWITEKIEGFNILGDLYKNRDLIGSILPDPAEEAAEDFAKINDSLKEGGALGNALSGIAEQCLLNEYLLNHFSNYTNTTNQGSVELDEAEYILTGNDHEGGRKATVIALLTGTRFALNIGYFVTSPVMMHKALVYATTVAGWSGIGIPIAQAAIIVTWSLAESVIDVEQLLDGKAVPLVKSPTTWVLSETGLIDAAKDVVMEHVQEAAEGVIDDTFDTVEEVVVKAVSDVQTTVEGQLNQLMDSLAAPLETGINDLSTKTLAEANELVNTCFLELSTQLDSFNGDGIIFETLKAYAQDWLFEIEDQIKQEVEDVIATPEKIIKKYKKLLVEKLTAPLTMVKEQLVSEIKEAGKKGRDALKSKLKTLLAGDKKGKAGSLVASTFKSGFLTMRYKDYLRLYFLTVPEHVKFERVRTIMERNVRAASNDASFSLDRLSCGMELKTSLSIPYFLTPSTLIPSRYKTADGKRHLIQRACKLFYVTGANGS